LPETDDVVRDIGETGDDEPVDGKKRATPKSRKPAKDKTADATEKPAKAKAPKAKADEPAQAGKAKS
jgi:hypothetical protein